MSYIVDIISRSWITHHSCILTIISPPILAAIIASFLAPIVGIRTFLSQQRVTRIQRIYYEESLLTLIKHLNKTIEITNSNLSCIEHAFNLILDLHEKADVSSTIDRINHVAKKITSPIKYQASKTEVLIKLFSKQGYTIHQWQSKFDRDFSHFNLYFREMAFALSNELESNRQVSREFIDRYRDNIQGYHQLVMRHYSLIYLLNNIAIDFSLLNFKSVKKLKSSLKKNQTINSHLLKIDEAYKTLFGYFKLEDHIFLSYLKDDNGDRYILYNDNNISIKRVKDNHPVDLDKMTIINDDLKLYNVKVEVNGSLRYYSNVQLGMANYCAFEEKPQFYQQMESFDNFK